MLQEREHVRTEWAQSDPILQHYYDTEWGMPVTDETGVFERLCLEAFQSGLSWLTILKRRDGFREAFDGFDPERIAGYTERDIERLLGDSRIIRNQRKVRAAVTNAQQTLELREHYGGGLPELVWSHMPAQSPVFEQNAEAPTTSAESVALAKCLKGHGFSMVGPTTMFALMSAIGIVDLHIQGSFRRGCSGLWRVDGTRTELEAPFQSSAG